MARCFFVTRHRGAIQWLARQGMEATLVSHLDPACLEKGDTVMGILPVHLVAEACARGARYLHLQVDVCAGVRGHELTADMMEALNARLVEFVCEPAIA